METSFHIPIGPKPEVVVVDGPGRFEVVGKATDLDKGSGGKGLLWFNLIWFAVSFSMAPGCDAALVGADEIVLSTPSRLDSEALACLKRARPAIRVVPALERC